MAVLGFPRDAAEEFAALARPQKQRILDEAKALVDMSAEQRGQALLELKQAPGRAPRCPPSTYAPLRPPPDILRDPDAGSPRTFQFFFRCLPHAL